MGEGIKMGGGGGLNVVNGVINEYLTQSGEIPANTFVEYVAEGITVGSMKTGIGDSAAYQDVVGVSGNRALMIYSDKPTNGQTYYLDYEYALLSLDGNAPTVLATGKFITNQYAGTSPEVRIKEVDMDKYVISLYVTTGGSKMCVCKVDSSNAVTFGALLSLDDCYSPDFYVLSPSELLFVHINGDYYVRAGVYTVNGMTVTAGTSTHVTTTTSTARKVSVGKIDDGAYLILFGSTSQMLKSCLISVSGSTVTILEDGKTLSGAEYTAYYLGDIHYIGNGRALVVKSSGLSTTDAYIYQVVNNVVSQVSSLRIYSGSTEIAGKICEMEDGTYVTTVHSSNVAIRLSISGDIITIENSLIIVTNANYAATYYSRLAQGNNNQFVVAWNSSDNGASAAAFQVNSESVKIAESSIHGLTKTKATTTKPGKVWVLAEEV